MIKKQSGLGVNMDEDFRKGDNSPLDSIKNLAHKSFTAKMEKAFAPLQELIILKMEANLSDLVLTKNQFLELMTNAGFDLNPINDDGDLNLTKQIQFIMDKGIRVKHCWRDSDGVRDCFEFEDKQESYIAGSSRELEFCW